VSPAEAQGWNQRANRAVREESARSQRANRAVREESARSTCALLAAPFCGEDVCATMARG